MDIIEMYVMKFFAIKALGIMAIFHTMRSVLEAIALI